MTSTTTQRTHTRRQLRQDRGETSIQMAIVFPFVIAATLLVVQVSLWYFAREAALTAAREGAGTGRTYRSTPADGAARARSVLDRTAGDLLQDASVSTTGSTAQRVRVQVRGTALSVLPGVPGLRITQSASGPTERWTTPGG
ncbi:TadE family protein [Streptomyces luteireticuli]|uniref:TadE family protein n=1 Tax=Streptomyces luteireticuli TaxID=173858 RepID=UPI003556A041